MAAADLVHLVLVDVWELPVCTVEHHKVSRWSSLAVGIPGPRMAWGDVTRQMVKRPMDGSL